MLIRILVVTIFMCLFFVAQSQSEDSETLSNTPTPAPTCADFSTNCQSCFAEKGCVFVSCPVTSDSDCLDKNVEPPQNCKPVQTEKQCENVTVDSSKVITKSTTPTSGESTEASISTVHTSPNSTDFTSSESTVSPISSTSSSVSPRSKSTDSPTPPSNSSRPTPSTTTVTSPSGPSTNSSATPNSGPSAVTGRRFDAPSFVGGIILSLGFIGICFVAFKFYKARTERNYHTLHETVHM